MKTEIKGTLEVDHERGVVYFHVDPEEVARVKQATALRIGGLPRPVPSLVGFQMDVNMGLGFEGQVMSQPRANWRGDGVMTDNERRD
jgi:hypothetical protein